MKQAIDVNYINPFLQAAVSIIEMTSQIHLVNGRPSIAPLTFDKEIVAVQLGITGELGGQVIIVLAMDKALGLASKMMFGMPVEKLDDMAISALSELGNMIMGNAATLFSSKNILIDITPPMILMGDNLRLMADTQAIKIPMNDESGTLLDLYICLTKD